MNRYLIFLLTSLLLLSLAKETIGGAKRVVCFYGGVVSADGPTLVPEAIDPTLCTHLVYLNPRMNFENNPPIFTNSTSYEEEGEGCFNRTLKLKELNPRLKVLLNVYGREKYSLVPSIPSQITEYVERIVNILSSYGFDGLNFSLLKPISGQWLLSKFLRELRKEFDKHDFLISNFIPYVGFIPYDETDLDAIKSYSDIIVVKTFKDLEFGPSATFIYSPLELVISMMDMYLAKEFPADKLLISIYTGGQSCKLKNINENGVGAEIAFDENGDPVGEKNFGYSKIMQYVKDGSGNWTVIRDQNTNSTYAISNTGEWISFDDPIYVRMKAAYVIEKNLGGAAIVAMDFDEFEGLVGEERFPLTRALYEVIVAGSEV